MFSFILGISESPREFREVLNIDEARYEQLHTLMRQRGIEYELDAKEPWFVCEALTEGDVDETLNILEDAVKELKK